MQFPVVVFINKISELTAQIWTADWGTLTQWWNDHDNGVRAWTRISTQGSLTTGVRQASSATTLTNNDQILLVDSTSATVAVTLPSASTIIGMRFTIKDWKGQSATHNITVGTTSSQKIDGSSTAVLSTNYQAIEVASDGANWSIISNK